MRPRVSPRSVVAGRSGGPCDDGCEVQRVLQLKQSCSKSIPRGAEPGGTGCSVSAYSEFMALMQEPRGHKGNVPRFGIGQRGLSCDVQEPSRLPLYMSACYRCWLMFLFQSRVARECFKFVTVKAIW